MLTLKWDKRLLWPYFITASGVFSFSPVIKVANFMEVQQNCRKRFLTWFHLFDTPTVIKKIVCQNRTWGTTWKFANPRWPPSMWMKVENVIKPYMMSPFILALAAFVIVLMILLNIKDVSGEFPLQKWYSGLFLKWPPAKTFANAQMRLIYGSKLHQTLILFNLSWYLLSVWNRQKTKY